jgi:hypothetical protein
MQQSEKKERATSSFASRIKSVLRDVFIAAIGGLVVLLVGDYVAAQRMDERIFQINVQNYIAACKILRELAAYKIPNIQLYDTTVYKNNLEYLHGTSAEQKKIMRTAMEAMENANVITTAEMMIPRDEAEVGSKQERNANNVVKLLSEYDTHLPNQCPADPLTF